MVKYDKDRISFICATKRNQENDLHQTKLIVRNSNNYREKKRKLIEGLIDLSSTIRKSGLLLVHFPLNIVHRCTFFITEIPHNEMMVSRQGVFALYTVDLDLRAPYLILKHQI